MYLPLNYHTKCEREISVHISLILFPYIYKHNHHLNPITSISTQLQSSKKQSAVSFEDEASSRISLFDQSSPSPTFDLCCFFHQGFWFLLLRPTSNLTVYHLLYSFVIHYYSNILFYCMDVKVARIILWHAEELLLSNFRQASSWFWYSWSLA